MRFSRCSNLSRRSNPAHRRRYERSGTSQPESYVIRTDQFVDDNGKHQWTDPSTPKVRVKVGWVKGLNRLYFL